MSSANFKLKRTAAASRGFLATARFSCLVTCRLSTDPKIRDLEWLNGWKGHVTLCGHYYELPLLFTVVCLLRVWPTHVTSGEVREGELQTAIRRIFGIRRKSADLPWNLYRRNVNKNANIIRPYIVLLIALSPFHWLQNTWLWMTLNRHFAF